MSFDERRTYDTPASTVSTFKENSFCHAFVLLLPPPRRRLAPFLPLLSTICIYVDLKVIEC